MRCPDWSRWLVVAAAMAIVLPATAHAQDYYRWVDDAGHVHYSDVPPANAVRGKHARLDAQGQVESDGKSADTAGATDKSAPPVDKAAVRQKKQDRILLRSYDSVASLQRTRDRRLKGVDGQLALARQRARDARKQFTQTEKALAGTPADGDRHAALARAWREDYRRLDDRRQELRGLRQKRTHMAQRFARELARYRELRQQLGEP